MAQPQKKKKTMTREEALQLYDDLQNSMKTLLSKNTGAMPSQPKKDIRQRAPQPVPNEAFGVIAPARSSGRAADRGATGAVLFLILCLGLKVSVSVMDYIGLGGIQNAEASMAQGPAAGSLGVPAGPMTPEQKFSPTEVKVLTALDARRAELEERSRRLDEKEGDFTRRDKEYAARLTEIRELTDKLKVTHDQDDRKKNTQLEQLANVYGSMNPKEAAQLIEQLDITIAFSLFQRMSEKKIGQILPLMSPERALSLTNMLSGAKAN